MVAGRKEADVFARKRDARRRRVDEIGRKRGVR